MPLYLVRHGEAQPETINPDRPLTKDGRATVERMALLASASAPPVTQILHSGKTRARETAEIMARYLKPSSGVKEIGGINPNDDVIPRTRNLDPAAHIMLVGHLPFLERMVSYLVVGEADRAIIRFQTGGIVCLDRDEGAQSWHITWALMPEMK